MGVREDDGAEQQVWPGPARPSRAGAAEMRDFADSIRR
jgi:hypothetical protein